MFVFSHGRHVTGAYLFLGLVLHKRKIFRFLQTRRMQVLFPKQTVVRTCYFEVLNYPAKMNVMLKITTNLQFLPNQSIKYE